MYEEYRDIVSVGELCVMLQICPAKAYRLLNENEIEAFRTGRSWHIPKISVINYIRRNMNTQNKK